MMHRQHRNNEINSSALAGSCWLLLLASHVAVGFHRQPVCVQIDKKSMSSVGCRHPHITAYPCSALQASGFHARPHPKAEKEERGRLLLQQPHSSTIQNKTPQLQINQGKHLAQRASQGRKHFSTKVATRKDINPSPRCLYKCLQSVWYPHPDTGALSSGWSNDLLFSDRTPNNDRQVVAALFSLARNVPTNWHR